MCTVEWLVQEGEEGGYMKFHGSGENETLQTSSILCEISSRCNSLYILVPKREYSAFFPSDVKVSPSPPVTERSSMKRKRVSSNAPLPRRSSRSAAVNSIAKITQQMKDDSDSQEEEEEEEIVETESDSDEEDYIGSAHPPRKRRRT
jgi:hypothetical protein